MSCFWNTIINKLENNDLINFFNGTVKSVKPDQFAYLLKEKNKKTNNILWQDNDLTERQKEENLEHIKNYDIKTINDGYLCSTCDPFLFLICELFEISIINYYNNLKLEYKNKIKSRYTISLRSDNGHMW